MHAAGATALIADDHEISRVALAGVLTGRLGFARVVETASFDEALDRLSMDHDIKLALFDLQMPGMSGPATLACVREVFPATRVAVVSGSTRRTDILEALAAGVHGYVPKTLRLDAIAAALISILKGGIFVPPSLAQLDPPEPRDPEQPPDKIGAPGPGGGGAPSLTPRQREVLELIRQGRSNKEIARALELGAGTVKVHVSLVLRALGVSNRAAAVAAAQRASRTQV